MIESGIRQPPAILLSDLCCSYVKWDDDTSIQKNKRAHLPTRMRTWDLQCCRMWYGVMCDSQLGQEHMCVAVCLAAKGMLCLAHLVTSDSQCVCLYVKCRQQQTTNWTSKVPRRCSPSLRTRSNFNRCYTAASLIKWYPLHTLPANNTLTHSQTNTHAHLHTHQRARACVLTLFLSRTHTIITYTHA